MKGEEMAQWRVCALDRGKFLLRKSPITEANFREIFEDLGSRRPRGGLTANGADSRIQAPMGRPGSGAVPVCCGVSVDIRMALGDDGIG